MKTIYTLLLCVFITACNKDNTPTIKTDSNGAITSLPYQWKKSLHQSNAVSNSYINKAIYYNGNIVIPTTNGEDNRLLTMINANNGETIWQWNDMYHDNEYIDISYCYQYQ